MITTGNLMEKLIHLPMDLQIIVRIGDHAGTPLMLDAKETSAGKFLIVTCREIIGDGSIADQTGDPVQIGWDASQRE